MTISPIGSERSRVTQLPFATAGSRKRDLHCRAIIHIRTGLVVSPPRRAVSSTDEPVGGDGQTGRRDQNRSQPRRKTSRRLAPDSRSTGRPPASTPCHIAAKI